MFIETTQAGKPLILNTSYVVWAEIYEHDVSGMFATKQTINKVLYIKLVDGDLSITDPKERDFIWKVLQDNVTVRETK